MTDESDIIDREALDRLGEWGGEELIQRMIRIFLDNSPDRMGQIRSGLEADDLSETERGAHSLKSSAGNLGAARLREICARMEDLAADEEADRVRELREPLESAYRQARDALSELLESIEAG